jgi:hypothetical protein
VPIVANVLNRRSIYTGRITPIPTPVERHRQALGSARHWQASCQWHPAGGPGL